MNFWRSLGGLVALACVGLAIQFAVFVKADHDAEVSRETSQEQAEQAKIETICEAMFPRSAVNKRKCIEGDL